MADRIEPLIQEPARERQRGAGGKFPRALPENEKGRSRDQVAAIVGFSARSLKKIRAVVEAAREQPRQYRALVEELDREGNVDRVYHLVAKGKQREADRAALKKYAKLDVSEQADLRHCSMVALLYSLEPKSVKAIITDPPSDRVALFEELARRAARVLTPDGVLAVMCGPWKPAELGPADGSAHSVSLGHIRPVRVAALSPGARAGQNIVDMEARAPIRCALRIALRRDRDQGRSGHAVPRMGQGAESICMARPAPLRAG